MGFAVDAFTELGARGQHVDRRCGPVHYELVLLVLGRSDLLLLLLGGVAGSQALRGALDGSTGALLALGW